MLDDETDRVHERYALRSAAQKYGLLSHPSKILSCPQSYQNTFRYEYHKRLRLRPRRESTLDAAPPTFRLNFIVRLDDVADLCLRLTDTA